MLWAIRLIDFAPLCLTMSSGIREDEFVVRRPTVEDGRTVESHVVVDLRCPPGRIFERDIETVHEYKQLAARRFLDALPQQFVEPGVHERLGFVQPQVLGRVFHDFQAHHRGRFELAGLMRLGNCDFAASERDFAVGSPLGRIPRALLTRTAHQGQRFRARLIAQS
jgi:hypothetical protein